MYYIGVEDHQMIQLIDDYYDCIYILKGEGIIIPYHYILESIYEDNPVETINQLLENDKVKQLKR